MFRPSRSNRKGQGLVEYAMLVVLVGLMSLSALMKSGDGVAAGIQTVPVAIDNASS